TRAPARAASSLRSSGLAMDEGNDIRDHRLGLGRIGRVARQIVSRALEENLAYRAAAPAIVPDEILHQLLGMHRVGRVLQIENMRQLDRIAALQRQDRAA